MKNNLVINPADKFRSKSNEFIDLYVDRYIFDQRENKKISDKFFSSKLDFDYRRNNFNLSSAIFYEIMNCIKYELNLLFNKNFDQKFYEIVIGSWLRKFIQQFILKYKNIIEISKNLKIHSATIYETKSFNFFTSETHTIQHATNDNLWNSCIYSYILNNLDLNIELKSIDPPEKKFDDRNYLNNTSSKNNKKNLKEIFINLYSYFVNLIPNYSNIFMYNTGFNLLCEKKIDLMCGQIPRIYSIRSKFDYSTYDKNLRKKFNFRKFVKNNNSSHDKEFKEIFNLIICMLDKSLPIFLVEDFNRLIKFIEKLNFPKNPKVICTSYAFEGDEPFKFYLAIKKFFSPKIKYFVYQHGGSYITRIDNSFYNECNTSDYFITWGEKTDLSKKNNLKFVNFKLLNNRYAKKKKLDKLLILLRSSGYNTAPYDRYSEGVHQIDLTLNFLKKFSNEIKKKTIIRAHYSSKNRMNHVFEHLTDFKIDYSEQNYFDAINSAKLIIFNHDSTGMLEMFALNRPTLCIWEKGDQHMNTFVRKDYELLKKAKILFDDKDMIYEHLFKIWDDPLKWWFSSNVQINLQKFINLYSKLPSEDFEGDFKKLIKSNI